MERAAAGHYDKLMNLSVVVMAGALLAAVLPARAETVHFPGGGGTLLNAELAMPAGPPVGPAVVALHGCGGAYPSRDAQWRKLLTDAGHIVLFPDSFGSRGLGSQCRVGEGRVATAAGLRREDALAAARWLAAQPFTPPGGVVVLGWSDGGSTTLALALLGADKPAGLLRGFVAFYPGCHWSNPDPKGPPILLMIGESDDWTALPPCRALAERVGPRIHMVTYPGAYHDFDAPTKLHTMGDIPRAREADHVVHAGQNPEARADALRRVPEFLSSLSPAP